MKYLLHGFFLALISFAIVVSLFYWAGVDLSTGWMLPSLATGSLIGSFLFEIFRAVVNIYSDNAGDQS